MRCSPAEKWNATCASPAAADAAKPVRAPGFYHRNTDDILLERVTVTLRAPDARPALRTDDASAPRLIEFSAPK